jgi:hypothetical protein
MNISVTDHKISVRNLEIGDHEKIVDYFLNADKNSLEKLGFDLVKSYDTIPGQITSYQSCKSLGLEKRKIQLFTYGLT